MVTTMWGDDDDISATICGGDLLWRISNYTSGGDDEMEMLLSFDICTEKIQFIQLPPECNSLIHNLDTAEDNCYELRHHLLEFKGYPCVARSEKTWIGERVEYHFKVHLFILKDKVDQIWIEEETFNVRLKEDGVELDSLLRDPFDRYFNKTRRSNDHRSHRTRMCSFSDQVMLYWFDGGCLIFYNLRMNHHNVAKGANPCTGRDRRDIFKAKLKGMATDPGSDGDDVPHCPCIDYQLHAQVENIISVKTFIPKGGEVGEFDNYEEFQQFLTDKQPVGWVATGRKSPKWIAALAG
ncbi:hypothetical protein C5167_048496 [Papaver somniferum]|uniref:Uncharacterized protein n=1 Tax=Papaver somniferum TaxID=3469 RepID=A0A4Y7KJH8_PAPSO|nr:hypothetical protein C5167_048496 [Papaver somniferum]